MVEFIKEYLELDRKKKVIEADMKQLKLKMIAMLEINNSDVYTAEGYTVSNKLIISRKFDTEAFKKDHDTMYHKYTYESKSTRFIVK